MLNNQLVRNDVTSLNFSNMDYFNIIFKLCKSKKEFYILKFTESHLEKYYSISAGKDLEKEITHFLFYQLAIEKQRS